MQVVVVRTAEMEAHRRHLGWIVVDRADLDLEVGRTVLAVVDRIAAVAVDHTAEVAVGHTAGAADRTVVEVAVDRTDRVVAVVRRIEIDRIEIGSAGHTTVEAADLTEVHIAQIEVCSRCSKR